jgi:cell division protein FtsQ
MSVGSRPPRSRPVNKRPSGSGNHPVKSPRSTNGTTANNSKSGARSSPKNTKVTRPLASGPIAGPLARPAARGTVSRTSAQRFAARVRARRRRRRLIIVGVLLLVSGIVWAGLKSPWATVERIEVTGTHRIDIAQVRAEAEPELGHPMLLARTAQIEAQVGRQRLVRSVRVQRRWPSGLRIEVQEREPVAALPVGSELALVDIDGVVIERVPQSRPPAGLPELQLSLGTLGPAGVTALRGTLAVFRGLPPDLAQQVKAIGADSPDGIWLTLKGGAKVEWGSSADSAQKARVLTALLPQKAVDYDVRSPDTPAVRRK